MNCLIHNNSRPQKEPNLLQCYLFNRVVIIKNVAKNASLDELVLTCLYMQVPYAHHNNS